MNMTTPTNEEVRRQFEAWATNEEFSVTRNNPLGQYDDFAVESRWTVWQAALSSPAVVALVEALKLADQFFDGDDNHWQWDDGEGFPASRIRTALAPFTTGAGHVE